MEIVVWILLLSLTRATALRVGSFQVNISNGTLDGVYSSRGDDQFLNLSNLGIRDVAPEAFENVTYITSLDLSHNVLSNLPQNVFSKLKNLQKLSLAENHYGRDFLSYSRYHFRNLSELKTLDVSDSKSIVYFQSTMLDSIPKADVDILVLPNQTFYLKPLMFNFNQELQFDFTSSSNANCLQSSNSNYIKLKSLIDTKLDSLACVDVSISEDGVVVNVKTQINGTCNSLNDRRSLNLKGMNIKGFKRNWYNLNNSTSTLKLVLNGNDIANIEENLLIDLPQNVIVVSISRNKIETLKNNVLKNDKVQVLDFSYNKIEVIENEAFKHTTVLVQLILMGNRINDLKFVLNLPKTIERLNLQMNNIEAVPDSAFSHLENLTHLDLSNNKIKLINSRSYSHLHKLSSLFLSDNAITRIESYPFDDLICLRDLFLERNNLTFVEKGFARKMNLLTTLDVSENSLSHFTNGIFHGLPLNAEVIVDRNNVTLIQPGLFKKL